MVLSEVIGNINLLDTPFWTGFRSEYDSDKHLFNENGNFVAVLFSFSMYNLLAPEASQIHHF